MSVDMMRWVISRLTAIGFILPAIGISHTFATVIRKRQAQERAKALKAEIDAKYQVLEDEAKGNDTFVASGRQRLQSTTPETFPSLHTTTLAA